MSDLVISKFSRRLRIKADEKMNKDPFTREVAIVVLTRLVLLCHRDLF